MRPANGKDPFLPDETTHFLAERTNALLQDVVRRDGPAYVSHLDGFVVALREELGSPGGLGGRHPSAVERKPYGGDVKTDGTGIESAGWFRASEDNGGSRSEDRDDAVVMSRMCALQWIVVLYENVVPGSLKAEVRRRRLCRNNTGIGLVPDENTWFISLDAFLPLVELVIDILSF